MIVIDCINAILNFQFFHVLQKKNSPPDRDEVVRMIDFDILSSLNFESWHIERTYDIKAIWLNKMKNQKWNNKCWII